MRECNRATLIAAWVLVAVLAIAVVAQAATDKDTVTAWVVCQPGDYVNVRLKPTTKSESIGRFETGYTAEVTGKTKDGFAHVKVSLEYDEGWIHAGYLVFDEPVWKAGALYVVRSNGRVACRKYVDGPRRCWVVDGSTLQVFWMAGEWAVTNKGFIKSEFIQPVGGDTP